MHVANNFEAQGDHVHQNRERDPKHVQIEAQYVATAQGSALQCHQPSYRATQVHCAC